MVELEQLGKVVETDVLVIGGGISGLFAGVRAKELVNRVTVVDKGPIGYTSQGYFAIGGHQTFLPGDNIDDWLKDVIYFHDGFCEQDFVESIYKETYDRIKDLERWGVEFIRQPDGQYRRFNTRGLEHVRGLRPHPHGAGGKNEIQALVKESNRLGVQLLSRICITDLLKRDGSVVGAIGFHIRSGEFYIFRSGAVVIASGQCSFKGHHEDTGFATGDGIAMALRAGAELVGMEFVTYHDMPVRYGWEALGTAFPMGAQILNAKGEAFMENYSPVLKNRIDYAYLARAMAMEVKEGRGPFYIDYSPIKPEDLNFLRKRSGWMELHIKKLAEAGIKPFDEKQPFMPLVYYAQGIRADIECRTAIPGLFIAGRVRGGEPGVLMGSWSIASCTVTGHRAGENAAGYARSQTPSQIDADEVRMFKDKLYAPLGRTGIKPEEVLIEIQQTLFPHDVIILKHEARLKNALRKIEGIRDELLPGMGAEDVHYLVEFKQVKNMVLIAEGVLRASLMRTESRGSHYREDFPSRDDKNWLKHIIVTGGEEGLSLREEPLPVENYRFKSTRFYSDNFKIPT